MDYCWPGNIRELENAVEHAFVTCRSSEIDIFDLPVEIRRAEFRPERCAPSATAGGPAEESRVSRTPVTRERLVAELERNRWNRGQAARGLGVDRTTVWRLMKRWGLR
jgi:transcriptional regulator of acetoin/glycerol metabolism